MSETDILLYKFSILVVDDDNNVLTLFTAKLSKLGYKVVTTDNAQSAFEIMKRNEIHLIITDVYMPGFDGTSFIEALNNDKSVVNIPKIIISSMAIENLRSKFQFLGAVDFFQKPVDFDKLFSLIFLLISEKHTIPDEELSDNSLIRKKQKIIAALANSSRNENFIKVGSTLTDSLVETMGIDSVSLWIHFPVSKDVRLICHSGNAMFMTPQIVYPVTEKSIFQKVIENGRGNFINDAFNSENAIDSAWAKAKNISCEVVIPIYNINQRTFLSVKEIDYSKNDIIGFLVIHRTNLISIAEFETLEKLIRQMSSILSHVYRIWNKEV